MANIYCTLDDLKTTLADGSWGGDYDTELERVCRAASRAIDAFCGREDGSFYVTTSTTRYFDGSGSDRIHLPYMANKPSVSIDTSWSGVYEDWFEDTDYFVEGVYGYNVGPWYLIICNPRYQSVIPKFPKSVKVTAKWGLYETVPDVIRQAAITQAIRFFKRSQQGFADIGAVVELGQITYVKKVDPDVQSLIDRSPFKEMAL